MKMKIGIIRTFILFFTLAVLFRLSSAFFATKLSSSHDDNITGLIRLRSESANEILRNLLQHQQIIEDTSATSGTMKQYPRSSQVMLAGVVSKRRVVGKHLVFLDVVPMEVPTIFPTTQQSTAIRFNGSLIYETIESIAPVHVIMMRDYWNNTNGDHHCNSTNSSCTYDIYHKIIQPGVHVQLTGHVGLSRNQAAGTIVFCHAVKYTLPNDNPQHLQAFLRYAREGMLDTNEVIDAIPLTSHNELTTSSQEYSLSELASDILGRFPKNYLFNPSKLMGSTNTQKRNLLPLAPPEFIIAPLFGIDRNHSGENQMIAHTHTLNEIVTVSGMVRNRRRFQGYITVLTLTEPILIKNGIGNKGRNDDTIAARSAKDFGSQQISLVLHPNLLNAGNNDTSIKLSQVYGNMFSAGACVSVQGYMTTGSSEIAPIMWASSCRILRSSWRPNAIRQVLDTLHEGKIAMDEAADALKLPGGLSQAEDIAKGLTSFTERQWLAAELAQSLQGQHSLLGLVTESMVKSLASFAYARDKYPVEHVNNIESELELSPGVIPVLQPSDGNLHSSTVGSRWQRAKKPQLKFMIEQIGTVLRSHPEYGQRKLKVVDIGGGRGLLSNLLAELFGDTVEVQVVDISRSATNNGMVRAKRRGLQNVQYTALDATTLDADGVDVVVALHACGALADVALGHAASQGAGFVVCPCCYLSNPHLRVPVPTDKDVRMKPIPVEEWLMVDPIQYEQLKRTAEVQGDIKLASKAMHTVCGLRSIAVERQWQGTQSATVDLGLTIKLKRFPIAFSTRNFCLIGSFNQTKTLK